MLPMSEFQDSFSTFQTIIESKTFYFHKHTLLETNSYIVPENHGWSVEKTYFPFWSYLIFNGKLAVGLRESIPSFHLPRKDLRRALLAAPTDRFSVLQLSGQIFVEDGDVDSFEFWSD